MFGSETAQITVKGALATDAATCLRLHLTDVGTVLIMLQAP